MPEADNPYITNPPNAPTSCAPLGNLDVPDGIFLPGLDTTDTYALRLIGRALEPVASSGEHAIVCPNAPCEPGDFVALIPMDDDNAILVRRLVMLPIVPVGVPHPASNAHGNVLVELLSERQLEQYRTDTVKAIHRVGGFLRADGTAAELPVSDRVRRGH